MRLAVIAAAAASVLAGPAIAYVSVNERELGRTDPRRAAFYSGFRANFNETYRDGSALGFSVGMPEEQALDVAAKRRFIVEPLWDALAEIPELETEEERRAAALATGFLILRLRGDKRLGAELTIDEDRVSSITVRYDPHAH
ncbi:MAG TPA: hypothetical protein VIT45_09965 [Allosphingosinicella sp.]